MSQERNRVNKKKSISLLQTRFPVKEFTQSKTSTKNRQVSSPVSEYREGMRGPMGRTHGPKRALEEVKQFFHAVAQS